VTVSGVTLVLGGARSGKSRRAQALAEADDGALVFIATAQAFDEETRERIARHRVDRGARWRTLEEPLALPEAIARATGRGVTILVDCLTLWASNLLLAGADTDRGIADLEAALARVEGRVILVSNEVGWGIVPDNALARRFRDVAGLVNQRVAAAADHVEFVVAGLPITLK
jgi:adenosylcobinamide kinase/adenosylcobinamide-phosphate guanylyltransferase